ncbi:MAG TPA: isochorismatase family cysteine hydrolase, partial [Chryseolinea sp.]|nr:isochorismatase family cysteine hydrolase [Chryseolinea sp.]
MEQIINNETAALLVMDVQGATVKALKDAASFFDAIILAVETARSNKIPVIYIVVGFRKGYPEVSPNNKSFSILKNGTMNLDREESYQVHASVAPRPGDIVITKRRVSAFTGSDLEVVLRSFGINRLVLSGIATGGVVLSTLREAADKDYAITVLSDCCADMDEEVHHVLTTKIFPRQAEVVTAKEWHAMH